MKDYIKKKIRSLKPSATLAINEKSKKLLEDGKKVFSFGFGQSPFPVPKIIEKELQKNAYQKNYLNVLGLEKLRKQVAKYHHKKNKYKYSPDNVVIGPGSKELIFQTQLVLNCDLILPAPSWVSYEPQAKILKKKVYWLPTSYESNWHLEAKTLEKFCKKNKKNKKLLILNSPNNPSGTTNDELKKIRITPEGSIAKNYAFDVTPAKFITKIITERKVVDANQSSISELVV